MKIVLVEWDDAFASGTQWLEKDDDTFLKVIPTTSVGIVVKETERELSLIGDINELHYSRAVTIPRGCIKRIRKLSVK